MHLLATLGASYAVVPEAFLMGNGPSEYTHVTVLATSGIEESVRRCRLWFAEHAPACELRILTIADLPDIRNKNDHARYEEALFRTYFDSCHRSGGLDHLHLCLAGGFKTISSAAHQTADLLGCGKLFHLTTPTSTPEHPTSREVFAAIESELNERRIHQYLQLIDLGPRPGWPTLQALASEAPPLPEGPEPLIIKDTPLRDKIFTRLRQANDLARSQHELATLPFPILATWTPAQRHWLEEPLDPFSPSDQAWVHALPKVELHCHLGGFATHGDLLNEVRAAAAFPDQLPLLKDNPQVNPPADWPTPQNPIGLEPYRKLGDNNGSALLRDPGCLKKHIELLYQHLQEQNVRYAEIRCSPANYTSPGRSSWTVLQEILANFENVAPSVPLEGAKPVAPSVPLAGTPNPNRAQSNLFLAHDPDSDFTQHRRDLPHRQQAGTTAFVTFRLADSLPSAKVEAWAKERDEFLAAHPKPWDDLTWKTYNRQFSAPLERWLDRAHGACHLRDPQIADLVAQALHHFDGQRYVLDHFVIMPNHVHVLVKPLPGFSLTKILHSWKSYTAKEINRQLGLAGQFWQHESFDHLVRSVEGLEYFRRYIQENPEKAKLKAGFRMGCGMKLVLTPDEAVGLKDPSSGTLEGTIESSGTLAPTIKLIIIATRQTEGDFRTQISAHLALAAAAASHWTDSGKPQVVGVDLAGYESPETRAHYFRQEFNMAHRAGLGITIHAGENDDAEGIWSALLDLNARRLGHALHLAQSPILLETVAQRRIAIEMCPYANLQIKGYPLDQKVEQAAEKDRYPLLRYLRSHVPVTVNTDNIGISAASLSDNLLLAARLCPGLTRLDLLRLLRNAADSIFASTSEQQTLLARLQEQLPTNQLPTNQRATD